MSRLPPRDPKLKEAGQQCHKCEEAARYIYRDRVWCRICLDVEQYPALAHLTQAEREGKRAEQVLPSPKRDTINTESLKKAKLGFGK